MGLEWEEVTWSPGAAMAGTPALREMQGPGSLSDPPLVIWAEEPKNGASWMEESGSALLVHYPKMGLRGLGVVEEEALKTQGPVVYFLALNMDKG